MALITYNKVNYSARIEITWMPPVPKITALNQNGNPTNTTCLSQTEFVP